MPELPEVETVRRTLLPLVVNRKITQIDVHYQKIIEGDVEKFIQQVVDQTIRDIDRVGKYLIFKLDHIAFLSHLRMEGKYHYVSSDVPLTKHDHIVFHLDNDKELRYHDTRKFGRMQLVPLDSYKEQLPLSKLGKEPMVARLQDIYPKLHHKKIPIKHVLLDQTIFTGIGNIYANEICFRMKLNPKTPASNLSKKRVQELIDCASLVLQEAIKQGGTTIHSFSANGIDGLFQVKLQVHGKKICPICKGKITKEMVKQRGTYYCKTCQNKRR